MATFHSDMYPIFIVYTCLSFKIPKHSSRQLLYVDGGKCIRTLVTCVQFVFIRRRIQHLKHHSLCLRSRKLTGACYYWLQENKNIEFRFAVIRKLAENIWSSSIYRKARRELVKYRNHYRVLLEYALQINISHHLCTSRKLLTPIIYGDFQIFVWNVVQIIWPWSLVPTSAMGIREWKLH